MNRMFLFHVILKILLKIATGGIIDPRQHHRVPINIAFRRGLFNKELSDKLEDTTDDTKGRLSYIFSAFSQFQFGDQTILHL